MLPFGLHCEPFIAGLEASLRSALPEKLLRTPPRRLWLVVGSCTLLACFHRIWPSTTFLIVKVSHRYARHAHTHAHAPSP